MFMSTAESILSFGDASISSSSTISSRNTVTETNNILQTQTKIKDLLFSSDTFMGHGVVVSMFDFHCSDRGSNPDRGSKIS